MNQGLDQKIIQQIKESEAYITQAKQQIVENQKFRDNLIKSNKIGLASPQAQQLIEAKVQMDLFNELNLQKIKRQIKKNTIKNFA